MTAANEELQRLSLEAGKIFTPSAPIDERSLFAGRKEQIRQVVDTVNQKGQHAIIFGERGVGKTSLANVLSAFFSPPGGVILSPRVNCDSLDSFESLWDKVFEQIRLRQSAQEPGFTGKLSERTEPWAAELGKGISPDSVRRSLTVLAENALPILIFDEFDRLKPEIKHVFADAIKTLSDHSVPATIVLVGVADSVDQLIQEHHSVERALVQIPMPRMSNDEIREVLDTGLPLLTMTADELALVRIVVLSQGLPHYTHLLGLYSVRTALDSGQKHITLDIVDSAIQQGLNKAQQSIRSAWHQATNSARKDNLFTEVLLACALAEKDQLGFFRAQDLREPMRLITGKQYEIPSFAQHLNEFSEPKRERVLEKTGAKRRYKFRFRNPLMQPFVIMQGFAMKRIHGDLLTRLRPSPSTRL
jgi:Cdc6-like AAA superfamily ATPase